LINPFGLQYSEVTASSLIKVDLQGNVVDPGTTNFGINMAGYTLHSAIHAARPDLRCVIHIHSPSVVAVSTKFPFHVLKFEMSIKTLSGLSFK
jgi:adducin